MRQILKQTYAFTGWEDSLEIRSTINWSPELPAAFKSQHGYDIKKHLPVIMWGNKNNGIQTSDPGRYRVVLNTVDGGTSYVDDYRSTLQKGYEEYLKALSGWLRDRLGLTLRTQTSYNMPMEMAGSIPLADVPECESLGFKNSIDAYRQFTGPAAMGGRNVVSNELGAVFQSAYSLTIPSLLHMANLAFAGGVNRMVLHGLTFGGDYGGTTWPGYSPFNYFVSELHSRRQPSWKNGMDEGMEYLARTQYLQQAGVSHIDVALYNHVSATNYSMPTLYLDSDLETTGMHT